ncbi:hypothetical protein ACQJBY_001563 [Aegilops geniculata]
MRRTADDRRTTPSAPGPCGSISARSASTSRAHAELATTRRSAGSRPTPPAPATSPPTKATATATTSTTRCPRRLPAPRREPVTAVRRS